MTAELIHNALILASANTMEKASAKIDALTARAESAEERVRVLVEQTPAPPTGAMIQIGSGIGQLQERCHALARNAGWWDKERNVGEMLCLVHSEISEAMEGARKDLQDDHLPHRKMLEVELADAVIRILDMAGGLGLDVDGAIEEKLAYNQRRADHSREARAEDHGKRF